MQNIQIDMRLFVMDVYIKLLLIRAEMGTMEFKKGSTLLDQRYKEGESSWGLKSGFLDVEDVESFVNQIKEYIEKDMVFYESEDEMCQDELKEDLTYFIDSIFSTLKDGKVSQ